MSAQDNSNDNAKRKALYIRRAKILKAALYDPRLNGTDYRVLCVLAEIANSLTGDCYPSHEFVAGKCGMSVAGARASIYRLRDVGYLQWQTSKRPAGKGKQNRYTFHLPDKDAEDEVDHRDENSTGRSDHLSENSSGNRDHCYENGSTTATEMPPTTATSVANNLSEIEPSLINLKQSRVDSSSARAKTDFPSGENSASLKNSEAAKPKEERRFLTEAEIELWENICFNLPPAYDRRLRGFFLSRSASDNQFFDQVRLGAIRQGNMPDGVVAATTMLDDRPEDEPTKH